MTVCKKCETEFKSKDKRQKFCSRSCAASYNNIGVTRHGGLNACLQCGVKIFKANKFCSYKCDQQNRYELYIALWKAGDVDGNSGQEGVSSHIRRYLFEVYNNKCQSCGWSKINATTGKVPLTINHIDGDYTNSCLDNLELLCPNCHSLTSNYGRLNKGKGRKHRQAKRVSERKKFSASLINRGSTPLGSNN